MRFFTLILLLCSFHLAQAQLSPITQVTLEFTPANGAVVTASATDTGSGLVIDGPINLTESTDYTLAILLNNGDTDITSEVASNGTNFQFFFEVIADLFTGDIMYADADSNNLPIGLASNWTSSCVDGANLNGNFRIFYLLFFTGLILLLGFYIGMFESATMPLLVGILFGGVSSWGVWRIFNKKKSFRP